MATYTASVTSDKSAEEVFAYLADFRTVAEWDPSITESTHIGGSEPPAEGARYHVVTHMAGKDTPMDYETVESERPARVVLRGENESAISLDTISIAQRSDGGCNVTYEAVITLKGAKKIADPLMGVALKRLGDKARDGLQQKLRSGAPE
jgi:uncharacterized protein YndB with AHSA1/START domain